MQRIWRRHRRVLPRTQERGLLGHGARASGLEFVTKQLGLEYDTNTAAQKGEGFFPHRGRRSRRGGAGAGSLGPRCPGREGAALRQALLGSLHRVRERR